MILIGYEFIILKGYEFQIILICYEFKIILKGYEFQIILKGYEFKIIFKGYELKRVLFENRPALYFCNYKDKKYTYVGYHNHVY